MSAQRGIYANPVSIKTSGSISKQGETLMNDFVENHTTFPMNLEQSTDDELRKLIAEAEQILDRRDRDRKKQALEKIQSIAKAHGLSVSVGKSARRGRPPKKKSADNSREQKG
jgi:hypothetical protein